MEVFVFVLHSYMLTHIGADKVFIWCICFNNSYMMCSEGKKDLVLYANSEDPDQHTHPLVLPLMIGYNRSSVFFAS